MHTTLEARPSNPSAHTDAELYAAPRLHTAALDASAEAYVLTLIAPDAIGVARTATGIRGADIVTSRGGRSGSQFWLVALMKVDPAERDNFLRDVRDLPRDYAVQLVPSRLDHSPEVLQPNEVVVTYANFDRVWLLHGFTARVESVKGDVKRLSGSRVPAAYGGSSLFIVRAIVRCPDVEALERALEALADEEGGEFSIGGRFAEVEPLAENEIAEASAVFDS